MSGCEETDFFWESWTLSGKRKRKTDSKKDRKCLKHENSITMKTDEKARKKKKKKNPKFKEAMEGRKAKTKAKKKKKNRLGLKLDDVIFTKAKPALHPCSNEMLKPDHLTQDSKKRTKRKKKVAFDLSPGYICVKCPKFISSSQQFPKESILSESVRHSESCSQVMATEHSRGQTHDNDSQSASDDINSQDLFITQKTFRASPSDPSSCEAGDKAFPATPQIFTQRDRLHSPVVQTNTHHEASYTSPQDSQFQQHHRKTVKHVQKPKTVQVLLTEEEEGLKDAHQNPRKGQLSFQTQTQFNTKLTKVNKVSCPAHIKPSGVNPYLNDPVVVPPSMDVTKKHSGTSSQQSPSCLQHTDEPSVLRPRTSSISTQTENFFTTELSSYLNFCLKSRTTVLDLKPLNLSLNQRATKNPGMCLSAKTSSLSGESHKDPNLHLSSPSNVKGAEVKKGPAGRCAGSASTQVKGERALSSQSESVDTTASSEDNEPPCRTGKPDMAQVRAVQMRLNESFFFKSKGERQSPRPASPLMKLAQSREVKSRKSH